MKISVTIPTYCRPGMLEESVRSVWNQTRLPHEILIGDDSPDMETECLVGALISESRIPIRYFHNRPSLGEARNVDRLFNEVSGDAILHMHDDDPVFPDCIRLLSNPLETHRDVIASFGLQRVISNSGLPIPQSDGLNTDFWRTPDRAGKVDGFLAGAIRMFPNNGFIVRSQQAKQVGYDDKGRAGYARDFYFGFRLGRLGQPFFFVPEFTAMCRLTENSESRNNPNSDNPSRTMSILLSHLSPQEFHIPEIKVTLRRLAPLAISVAARRGERRKALGWLFSTHYRHAIVSPRWWWRFFQCLFNDFFCGSHKTKTQNPC